MPIQESMLILPGAIKEIVVPFATALADCLRPVEIISIEWRGPDYEEIKTQTRVWPFYYKEETVIKGSYLKIEIRGKRGFCVEAAKYAALMMQTMVARNEFPGKGSALLCGPADVLTPIRTLPKTAVAKVVDC